MEKKKKKASSNIKSMVAWGTVCGAYVGFVVSLISYCCGYDQCISDTTNQSLNKTK